MRVWRTSSADQPEPERQEPCTVSAISIFIFYYGLNRGCHDRDYGCRSPSLPQEHDPNNLPHPGSPSIR